MSNKTYAPGDIVKLGGIEFVVLDNNMAGSSAESEVLFILALKSQGQSRFGNSNNYANGDLRDAVCNWLDVLADSGVDIGAIKPRVLDLTTTEGYKGYGSIEVKAAPLTMDEARKYAEVIPNCNEATWLSTGCCAVASFTNINGEPDIAVCSKSYGIRPAVVVPTSLLDPEDD